MFKYTLNSINTANIQIRTPQVGFPFDLIEMSLTTLDNINITSWLNYINDNMYYYDTDIQIPRTYSKFKIYSQNNPATYVVCTIKEHVSTNEYRSEYYVTNIARNGTFIHDEIVILIYRGW